MLAIRHPAAIGGGGGLAGALLSTAARTWYASTGEPFFVRPQAEAGAEDEEEEDEGPCFEIKIVVPASLEFSAGVLFGIVCVAIVFGIKRVRAFIRLVEAFLNPPARIVRPAYLPPPR